MKDTGDLVAKTQAEEKGILVFLPLTWVSVSDLVNSQSLYVCVLSRVWLLDTSACNPLGSSVHGIFQARILEWVAISYSTGSSYSRYWTYTSSVPCIAGEFFTTSPTGSPSVSS